MGFFLVIHLYPKTAVSNFQVNPNVSFEDKINQNPKYLKRRPIAMSSSMQLN